MSLEEAGGVRPGGEVAMRFSVVTGWNPGEGQGGNLGAGFESVTVEEFATEAEAGFAARGNAARGGTVFQATTRGSAWECREVRR